MSSIVRLGVGVCCVALWACSPSTVPAHATSPVAQVSPAKPSGPPRPSSWGSPEVLVAPSYFHGIHGVAVDKKGRLLAGTVVGNDMWEVDRSTGTARVFIPAPQGESDDIAIGPKGELAWTSYTQGIVRYRTDDDAPIQELAKGLIGINSLAFDQKSGKLYASQVFLGDALWEIDVAGKAAPRQIAKDLGGFNGFEVGPDGQLYGPLWFKGQVVKIHPTTAKVTVINSELQTPAAANLDGKGNLWVVDTKAGTLNKVVLASGKKTEVAKLATALDNLALAPDGTVYVSNMADNSIHAVNPETGDTRLLTSGKLSSPSGLKLDGDSVLVADVFAFRSVDAKSGEVKDIFRVQDSKLEYPASIGLGAKLIALTSWFSNSVQLIDRQTKQDVEMVHGFKVPMDSVPADDGTLYVLELGTGSIIRATGPQHAERTTVAAEFVDPAQMILGSDGALYVTETRGRLIKVDIATGAKTVITQDLAQPEGLAQTAWGTFIVAEAGSRRVVEVDASGGKRVVAEDLPIGLDPKRVGMPKAFMPTGVAVSADGTVFVSGDLEQSLLRIRPQG
ncbi:MAG: hypothetical protein ABW321_01785 [Polyangiales bacterium]